MVDVTFLRDFIVERYKREKVFVYEIEKLKPLMGYDLVNHTYNTLLEYHSLLRDASSIKSKENIQNMANSIAASRYSENSKSFFICKEGAELGYEYALYELMPIINRLEGEIKDLKAKNK